eukprot:TRINITY_DN13396_c0_g1_i2.p1 TRINITY_DN13396_c0_g1~~TRINITY_DN13396_c0_g1_i2.p1  ORF type:complete len:524 (-),score=102.67 TRINITY_DN13396_c0_g1_i2:41-1612(-)
MQVNAMLTDLYQLTMGYSYWKNGRQDEFSVFDMFYRRNPFKGEYAIFYGLEDALKFIADFGFTQEDVDYLKSTTFKDCDEGYFDWLLQLDTSAVKVYAVPEGSVVFPRIPLMRIEGPLAVCQLLETTLLNIVNFATLVGTNAARMCYAGKLNSPDISLIEFGLRRAQGPDGGMSASKYSYLGGFDGTSNVLAGQRYGIPIKGTHAHSYVSSYSTLSDLKFTHMKNTNGDDVDFLELVLKYRKELDLESSTHEGELASFISYAYSFPKGFLALIDTYNTMESGIINFMAVALALNDLGFNPIGIRLDSGDLAADSLKCRQYFTEVAEKYNLEKIARLSICASSDIEENLIHQFNENGHSIDVYGVGTNLVTCKGNPALGGVFKLVQIEDSPRLKLSSNPAKITIPGSKNVVRLSDETGPFLDLLLEIDEQLPIEGEPLTCYFYEDLETPVTITPVSVVPLYSKVWEDGKRQIEDVSVSEIRNRTTEQLLRLPEKYKRRDSPEVYNIAISEPLQRTFDRLKNYLS